MEKKYTHLSFFGKIVPKTQKKCRNKSKKMAFFLHNNILASYHTLIPLKKIMDKKTAKFIGGKRVYFKK